MVRIFKYLKIKEWLAILISIVFIVAQVWLDLKLPEYMQEITTLVETEGSAMQDILIQGGYMLLCAIGSVIAAVAIGFLSSFVAATMAMRLRKEVFNKTISFSMEEINNFSTASLITRSTNDITQIQMFIGMGLQFIVRAPIMAVWAIIKIYNKSWEWTLSTAIGVVILVSMLSVIIIFAVPKFKIIQNLTDSLNRVTRENLSGLRVIRAYNAEDYQENKFDSANIKLTKTNLFTNRLMAIIQPTMTIIASGLSVAIYWIGAILINNASFSNRIQVFSDMIVFSSYAMQVIMSFMMLTMIFIMLPRASVSAKRIMAVLDTKPRIIDGKNNDLVSDSSGDVEFRNVFFAYPDAVENVLENISFTLHQGESLAIIGATGSGKSTLVNLLPRFYDVSQGEILIDGINVKEYSQENLHQKIGYVSQKAILFSGTIASNVTYGSKTDSSVEQEKEDILQALKIAQAEDFVHQLPKQELAQVAQGGSNFSGGQKQRISIARAIYKKPEIYVFDDSFSALDYKTDKLLREALRKYSQGVTSIIVAQRIGTIKDADHILVLDEGKIVGYGKHQDLLTNCEVYREIALSQLTQEELNHE